MLGRMSSREFSEWMAFYNIDPFGDQRADLRAAIQSSLLFNVNRGKGQSAKSVEDYMPFSEKPKSKGLTGKYAAAAARRLFRRK